MNRFKIEFIGWGVKYQAKYATTPDGALRVATAKGWRNTSDSVDTRPCSATIYERTENDTWEQVATISANEAKVRRHEDRRSFKAAEDRIAAARKTMDDAQATMRAFCDLGFRQVSECASTAT